MIDTTVHRKLTFEEVKSICGEKIAAELYSRLIPEGLDLGNPGDLLLISKIVEEAENNR